jgi:hypothetical protein
MTRKSRGFHDPFDFLRKFTLSVDADGAETGGAAGASADNGGADNGADGGANADAADATGDAGGADGADRGDKGADQGGDVPARYEPEGVDPNDLGETDQETIDKLLKRQKGLREELAKKPGAPKTADDYPAIEFDEAYSSAFGDPKDDDLMKLVRDTAHKHGLSADAYQGFVRDVLQGAAESGVLERPLDLKGEIERAGGQAAYDEQVQTLGAKIDGFKGQGKLTEQGAAELKPLLVTAGGQEALKFMFGAMAERGVQVAPGESAGGEFATMEQVKAAMSDPRYDTTSLKYDAAYVEKVRAAHKRLSKKS